MRRDTGTGTSWVLILTLIIASLGVFWLSFAILSWLTWLLADAVCGEGMHFSGTSLELLELGFCYYGGDSLVGFMLFVPYLVVSVVVSGIFFVRALHFNRR